MTDHAQKIFTQFLISQNVAILSWLHVVLLVVGLIDIEHIMEPVKDAVCNQGSAVSKLLLLFCLFVFCFKNGYYFSDLETQWPRNPE